MTDRDWLEYKIRATRTICWSGAATLIGAGIPLVAILAISGATKFGVLLIAGILVIQIMALVMVWASPMPKRQEPAVISLPPVVKEGQRRLESRLTNLQTRLDNLETMDRVDRFIEARRFEE